MKRQALNCFLSFFLVTLFSVSLVAALSLSAFASSDIWLNPESFSPFSLSVIGAIKKACDSIDVEIDVAKAVKWPTRTGPVTKAELEAVEYWYNTEGFRGELVNANPVLKNFYEALDGISPQSGYLPIELQAGIQADPLCEGVYRLRLYGNGAWVVDANGVFPYCTEEEYLGVSSTPKPFSGRWLITNSIRGSKKVVQKSYADMDATKADLANKFPNSSISLSTLKVGKLECKVIRRLEEGPGNRDWVWCDPNGLPYVYIDSDTQGAAQDWNYDKIQEITDNQTQDIKDIVIEQGDKIDKLIDIDTNTTLAPNVSLDPSLDIDIDSLMKLNIDKITIDRSDDRTIYSVDSHDVTYNVQNNYYEYNYYTYNYEFTYNNTYVTYVGSTAEYQPKEWSLYYQLPDGRSSADLTEEDVAGLSFQFQDVINYKRASTSADLWALYHFDGNTDDDSYYAQEDSFSWGRGSSINYMEANAFGGALYLDEQPHLFTLTLPSNLGTRDFTLQWRYYQNSAVTSENAENHISAGGKELLRWSEKNLYLSGSSEPCADKLSIGSWQELALVRSSGMLYLYHNGAAIAQTPISNALGKELTFYLGGSSRAYSMIDELRLITRPIATDGKSYTPTAVPYDSNSVLVLPGESTVTDSYYKWDTTRAPLWSFDVEKDMKVFREFGNLEYNDSKYFHIEAGEIYTVNSPNVASDGSLLTLSAGSSAWDYGFRVDPSSGLVRAEGSYANAKHPGFLMALTDTSIGYNSLFPGQQTMALTFVGADLERYTIVLDAVQSGKTWTSNFSWGTISVRYHENYDEDTRKAYVSCDLVIQPKANSSFSFRYIELVPGSIPNTGHQLVTDTYNTADLKANTAAVQTDIPIMGYTVGGVRPTFPSRGDVWFPAEGNRISGVQVYNGQAWEETNARWWTGKRWIPIYAFDLVTLADMWDVGSSTGQDVTPTITTEIGFWNWWKNQWLEFRQWMKETFGKCEHDYVEEVLKEPTCTKEGAVMYTCSKCRDSYISTLQPLGHDWVLAESVPDVDGFRDVSDQITFEDYFHNPIAVLNDGDLTTTYTIPDVYDVDIPTSGSSASENMGYLGAICFNIPDNLDIVKVEAYYFYDVFAPAGVSRTRELRFNLPTGLFIRTIVDGALDCMATPHVISVNNLLSYSVRYKKPAIGCSIFPVRAFGNVTDGHGDVSFGSPTFAELRFYTSDFEPGYDKYVCSHCGLEYVDHDRTGPPEDLGGDDDPSDEPADGDSSLVTLIQDLFDAAGDLVGKLIGWVFDLAAEAMEGFGKLGDYFAEKAEEVKGFGGQYAGFLGVFFEAIPPEIKSCISIALILLGISLFVRKVLM